MLGHVGDQDVVLVRSGSELFAVGANCTHYREAARRRDSSSATPSGVRCITRASACARARRCAHRARSDCLLARRGARAIGFSSGDKMRTAQRAPAIPTSTRPSSIVIVGGGAAGVAAAEMIRREGYDGPLTMISADAGSAGRSSQSFEGLPGGRGAGRLDSALARRVLCRETHRACSSGAGWPPSIRRGEPSGSTMVRSVRLARCSSPPARIPMRLPIPGADRQSGDVSALVRRQPRDCRAREQRQACRGRGRELHRPRSGGVAACARDRRRRGRAPRACRSSASWVSRSAAFVRSLHEAQGVDVSSRADREGGRWTHGHPQRRNDARCGFRGDGRRRQAGDGARRAVPASRWTAALR